MYILSPNFYILKPLYWKWTMQKTLRHNNEKKVDTSGETLESRVRYAFFASFT